MLGFPERSASPSQDGNLKVWLYNRLEKTTKFTLVEPNKLLHSETERAKLVLRMQHFRSGHLEKFVPAQHQAAYRKARPLHLGCHETGATPGLPATNLIESKVRLIDRRYKLNSPANFMVLHLYYFRRGSNWLSLPLK